VPREKAGLKRLQQIQKWSPAMNQIKKKTEESIPSFQPRVGKNLFVLLLCLLLAMLSWTSPLSACVGTDISHGYSASRAPNQINADLQDASTHNLLARGGGGGGGGGKGQGKGGGGGSGQCDGSGSGQGQGKGAGYGAKDGTGTGERSQDGSGYGAGSGQGTKDGSGKGTGSGPGRANR
jgi:hypothetical protein